MWDGGAGGSKEKISLNKIIWLAGRGDYERIQLAKIPTFSDSGNVVTVFGN